MRCIIFPLIAFACLAVFFGCQESADPDGHDADRGDKIVVYTTNYPLAYFAERITGDAASVRFPEIDGDPAFWQPSSDQVTGMQGAGLIITNGAGYEKWAKMVSLPRSNVVDTSLAFASTLIETEQTGTHSHGGDGEHSHAGTAFTTWMDFEQARQQATAVRDALIEVMPDQEKAITENAEALLADLAELHEAMQAVTDGIGDTPLVASHPVYQYFARQYGLDIQSVLWEPETVPSTDDMQALQTLLEDHAAVWMIWEGDPVQQSVDLLKGIGIASVVVDPAGNRPDQGDWLSVMRKNIENLRDVADSTAN